MKNKNKTFLTAINKIGNKGAKAVNITAMKGGVGKTSINANLAAAIGEYGKKVLVIDCDMQGSLTSNLIRGVEIANLSYHLYDRKFDQSKKELDKIIRKTNVDNVDVIPGGDFKSIEFTPGGLNSFKHNVKLLKDKYDYDVILFDFGAKQEGMNVIADMVVDSMIIISNSSAWDETLKLVDTIKDVEDMTNKSILKGILINNIDLKNDATDKAFLPSLKNKYKDYDGLILKSIIPASKTFKKSTLLHKWVIDDTRLNNSPEGNPMANLVTELVEKDII